MWRLTRAAKIYVVVMALYNIAVDGFSVLRSLTLEESYQNVPDDVQKEDVPPEVRKWLLQHRFVLIRRSEMIRELEDSGDEGDETETV